MKHFFKSIHSAMLFAFLSLLIPIILVFFWVSVNFTENSIIENSKKYTYQLIDQVNDTVDSYIDFMENISNIALYSGTHYKYLVNDFKSAHEEQILRSEIINQFSTVIETRNDIYCIGIMGQNGKILINDDTQIINENVDVREKTWYNEAIEAKGAIVLTAAHVQNLIDNNYRWVVNLSRAVMDPSGKNPVGVFWVDLNFNTLSNLCDGIDLGKKGYVFVLDKKGNIVYHPKQELIYSGLKLERTNEAMKNTQSSFIVDEELKGESKLFTVSRSEKTGWAVVGVSFVNELLKAQEKIKRVYLGMVIMMIPIVIIISYILSKKITRPIKMLKNSMKEVELGNFNPASPILIDGSEIGKLGKTFSIMTEKIGSLMDEKLRDEKFKREAEMKALQSQINPHFIYNTLDSIVWMAESGNNDDVILMTVSLARLLRLSISNESSVVRVWDEIKYCESYLTIQKQRYLDELSYEINISEDLMECPIIKLTLQPLVENAIYHGIKYGKGNGKIIISGYLTDEFAFIVVEDNGAGMSNKQLLKVLDKKETEVKKSGLGVYNVNQRIKLYFGTEYGLYYESIEGEGTKVSIKLPKTYLEPELRRY